MIYKFNFINKFHVFREKKTNFRFFENLFYSENMKFVHEIKFIYHIYGHHPFDHNITKQKKQYWGTFFTKNCCFKEDTYKNFLAQRKNRKLVVFFAKHENF